MYVMKMEVFKVEYDGSCCKDDCKNLCEGSCTIFSREINEDKFTKDGNKKRLNDCIKAEEFFKTNINLFLKD